VTALEALANATIGLIVSWAATFFVLGYTASGSAAVTGMFFALSFARSYVLRRIFTSIARKRARIAPQGKNHTPPPESARGHQAARYGALIVGCQDTTTRDRA
jgi:hypothetical protein